MGGEGSSCLPLAAPSVLNLGVSVSSLISDMVLLAVLISLLSLLDLSPSSSIVSNKLLASLSLSSISLTLESLTSLKASANELSLRDNSGSADSSWASSMKVAANDEMSLLVSSLREASGLCNCVVGSITGPVLGMLAAFTGSVNSVSNSSPNTKSWLPS